MKITDRSVEALKPPREGKEVHYDDKLGGFGVRVSAGGVKSFVLNYRTVHRRERRYTIGRFPELSSEEARDKAAALRVRIKDGADPQEEKEKLRGEANM